MIKATELRIGNFVYSHVNERQKEYMSDQYFYVVKEIKDLKVHGGIIDIINGGENIYESTHLPYDKINPIPLAEEWLIKFWFELRNGKGHNEESFEYEKGGICFSLNEVRANKLIPYAYTEDEFIKYFFKETQFAHQLQNLYYALTGEELTLQETPKPLSDHSQN